MTDTLFNLALESEMPDDWTPLEAVVIVECLDGDGESAIWFTATPKLPPWRAVGLAEALRQYTGDELRESSDSADSDEES
jgi:hypothetical protein